MTTGSRAARIETMLREHFRPAALAVEDESARHAGHAGAAPGGETHFNVAMTSAAFAGLNRVARSRAVYQALDAEMQTGLHALALTLRAPGED